MSKLKPCAFCQHETPHTVTREPLGSGTRTRATCDVCGGGQVTDSFPRPDKPEGVYTPTGCRVEFTRVIAPTREAIPLVFLEAFGEAI
ncbi:MAG TPA: hypothetical protein VF707_04280 [Ardenticatenaceae bacterium]|jgi:hypothetical protein